MRVLPWFQEAARRLGDSLTISDCKKCQKMTTQETRQSLGCGYEPAPDERVPVVPWDHSGRRAAADEIDETGRIRTPVCPGYLCNLPEVIEVARARFHWGKGALGLFCDERPTESLMALIEVLEGASNEAQHWMMTPASKGGGGPG